MLIRKIANIFCVVTLCAANIHALCIKNDSNELLFIMLRNENVRNHLPQPRVKFDEVYIAAHTEKCYQKTGDANEDNMFRYDDVDVMDAYTKRRHCFRNIYGIARTLKISRVANTWFCDHNSDPEDD